MVQMNSSFDNPTCAENGLRRPAFKGWKSEGHGFGDSIRPIPNLPRSSPKGVAMYRASAFWKTKMEDSQIPSGFGFGDRAGFVDPGAKWKLDPANYGDVSPLVCKVKRDSKRDITLKPRFVRPESLSHTPGPKYDVQPAPGADMPAFTMNGRFRGDISITPGPGQYETRTRPGKNYPITYGCLYDIVLQGRTKYPEPVMKNPGPGTYMPAGFTDKYNVAPIPPPKGKKKRKQSQIPGSLSQSMAGAFGESKGGQVGESTLLLAELTQSAPDLHVNVHRPHSSDQAAE
jgi:hypothetical protein